MKRQEVEKILKVIEKITSGVPEEIETPFGKTLAKMVTEEEARLIQPIWLSLVSLKFTTGGVSFESIWRLGGSIIYLNDDTAHMCFYDKEHYEDFCFLMRHYIEHLSSSYKSIKYTDLIADRRAKE